MKDSFKIRRNIILAIVILIPLLASGFIGIYAYNRYQTGYFDTYMSNIEEDTNKKVHGYLKYSSSSYEEEPYYHEDVKKDGETVLTIDVFRSIIKVTSMEGDKEVITDELHYNFAIYNINYSRLVKLKGADERLSIDDLPVIYLKIKDQNDASKEEVVNVGAPQDYIFIYDYNAAPEKDSFGNEFNDQFLKWINYTNEDFSEDVTFEFVLSDNPEKEHESLYYQVITSFTKEDFKKELTKEDTNAFTKGADSDITKAGYFGFVLTTKIWWQSLIAVIVVGFISFSFYVVWKAEVELNRKKVKK